MFVVSVCFRLTFKEIITQFNTAISDIPLGTLRSSQNRHLSEHSCDLVLFDYVSFIRLPQETKALVSITGVISVVEYIANSLKL